jgi:hypothetical protein
VPNKMTAPEAISTSAGIDTATFAFETPPTFDTVEDERSDRKQELALAPALRLFGKIGFGEQVSGHITVRDPQNPQRFWVNSFGVSLRRIKASHLIRVDHEGNTIDGNRPVHKAALNKAALCIHCEVHKARPDALRPHTHIRCTARRSRTRTACMIHLPRASASSTTTTASATTSVVWSPTARRGRGSARRRCTPSNRTCSTDGCPSRRDRPRQRGIAAGR